MIKEVMICDGCGKSIEGGSKNLLVISMLGVGIESEYAAIQWIVRVNGIGQVKKSNRDIHFHNTDCLLQYLHAINTLLENE